MQQQLSEGAWFMGEWVEFAPISIQEQKLQDVLVYGFLYAKQSMTEKAMVPAMGPNYLVKQRKVVV